MMKNSPFSHYDIIFFDTPFVQLKRFCANIAAEIRNTNKHIKMAAVILVQAPKSLPIKMEDCPESLKSVFDDIILFEEIDNLDRFLEETTPNLLFFGANRIPDLEIVLHAKKKSIKTYALQHGLYFNGCCINEFNVHNSFLALKTADKVLNYLRILKRMSKYDKTPFLKVIKRIFFKKGELQSLAMKSFSIPLTCDKAFVIGDMWKNYYCDVFGYRQDQLVLIGSHDLDTFNENAKIEPAICYIASTLVEEGSVSRKEFLKFVDSMSKSIDKKTRLYVKLHPLSDRTLFKSLEDHNVVFLDKQGELPPVTVYISNHSTLIGKSLFYSDQLILWQFKSEKECFYGDYAFAVCKTKKELENALKKVDMRKTTNEMKTLIEKMYYKNPRGAFRSCADYILEKNF